MNSQIIREFESYDDQKLNEILRNNIQFTDAVVLAIPELASDAAFDLYGKEWLRRYWKKVVIEVQGGLSSEGALKWALESTAGSLSALIAGHFQLPEAAIPAAIALAVLIIRTAKSEHTNRSRSSGTETKG